MNLPNKLTVSRFALTAVFLWAMFSKFAIQRHAGAVFLLLRGRDGFSRWPHQRARGLITNFGILMDPLADKVMTCSAFVARSSKAHILISTRRSRSQHGW